MKVRVIGVGGPRGDDALGCWVADSLRGRWLPGEAEVLSRDRPGLGLLEELEGLDAVVLVDAMRGGGPAGCVRILAPEDLARGPTLSSHGLGIAASLALAEALGRRLPVVRLVGIEVAETRSGASSEWARRLVPEACTAVVEALQALCLAQRGDPSPSPGAGKRTVFSGNGELL